MFDKPYLNVSFQKVHKKNLVSNFLTSSVYLEFYKLKLFNRFNLNIVQCSSISDICISGNGFFYHFLF